MTHVYTLKIRFSGEEDDVFVFSTREKAEAKVFEYFEDHAVDFSRVSTPDMISSCGLINAFQEHLFSRDIGYFDINLNRIL